MQTFIAFIYRKWHAHTILANYYSNNYQKPNNLF